MPDPTKKPGGDRPNLLEGVKRICRKFKTKLSVLKKGRETSDKKSSIASDLKSAFGHINPQKAILAVGGCIFAVYLLSGLYVVNPGEQAVIRRFGAPLEQAVSEGLHYRLPFPIDTVEKVNVSEVRRADIGMTLPEHLHAPDDAPQAIQLLTGDENIITSQAIVHYKVSDATKFLYNVNGNSEQLVRYSVEAALVQQMAATPVDDILSTEKVAAQNSVMALAQEALQQSPAHRSLPGYSLPRSPPG